jgi:hypothetical protein
MPPRIPEVINRCKEICSKLNAPTVVRLPWSHSNPQQVNQPTAKRVFPNAGLTGQKAPTSQAALTLNKHGRDEEITVKQRGKKPILALSDGRTAWKKQQLVKKRIKVNRIALRTETQIGFIHGNWE